MSLGQCNPQSKMMWHTDRIQQWLKTGNPDPLIFEIDPSNKCNQDCPWCSFSRLRSESKSMMCYETARALLYYLERLGVKAINWTGGGEPLMNPRIVEMIEYANMCHLDQGMFTNGLLLNARKANHIIKNLDWIRFSVDGYDEKSYSRNHGTSEGAFNTVIDNIKYACTINNRCTIGFGYIMTKDNYDGAGQITEIAKKCGVDYIQFKPVVHRKPKEQLSPDIVDFMYETAMRCKKYETNNFKVMVTKYRFDDLKSPETNYGRCYKKCLSHHFQGAVGADGKVYLCDHHKGEKEYELGDLQINTMEEIWCSDKRKNVIEWLDTTDLSQCMDCCRNHELNKLLWHIANKDEGMHPNHI